MDIKKECNASSVATIGDHFISKDHFQELLDLVSETGEAIVILQDKDGVEGKHVFVNDLWSSITGYSREELLNMSVFALISFKYVERAKEKYRLVIEGVVLPGTIGVSIINKSKRAIPVRLRVTPFKCYGINSVLLHLRRLSKQNILENELLKEKEKYAFLFENAPIPTAELDLSERKQFIDSLKAKGITDIEDFFVNNTEEYGKFISKYKLVACNKAVMQLHEVNDAEDIRLRGSDQQSIIFREKNPDVIRELLKQHLDIINGIKPVPVDTLLSTAGGKPKNIISYYFVSPDDVNLSRVIWSAIDITGRIEAENELREYKDHLEEMVKKRTSELKRSLERERKLSRVKHELSQELETKIKQQAEFIRRVIHDLKSPLLPMLGTSQMMLAHVQDEHLKQMALNINRGAKKLNNSINDLVDVMRGEIGILRLDCRDTDPAQILADAGEFFAFEAERNSQTLKIQLQKNLPEVKADPERLKQVIMNLLENAIRHTLSGGVITLKAMQKGSNLIVEVNDTGKGIREKDMPHLFEPYYSTEKGSREVAGLGLGLPLSKIIIELHGGSIWAKNREGRGANIGFSIPIKRVAKHQCVSQEKKHENIGD